MAVGLRTTGFTGLIVVSCLIVVPEKKSRWICTSKSGKYEEPSLSGSAWFMAEAGGHTELLLHFSVGLSKHS